MVYKVEEQNKNRIVKTFESFLGKSKWDKYQNVSKPQEGEVDLSTRNKILDVENFNKWLAEDFTGYGYQTGAPGLIGRVDKLSYAMLVSYFLDQGVECSEQEIYDFESKIKKHWNEKR
ncbi:MAG: hypothetical protein M0R46_17575 [Candidatus Muirbacterium halophilum]|nr:hypothetical protein [Candidatus Muirbacterium halophilum]